jgi:polyisoprenyl-phosphate glycosyltransferase
MPSSATMRLRVVVPVFNYWESFDILLRNLDRVAEGSSYLLHVTAIDDGSTKCRRDVLQAHPNLAEEIFFAAKRK